MDAIRKVTTGTSYEYDTVGNRVKQTVEEGTAVTEETAYTYNGLNQLLTSVTTASGGKTSSKTYVYDKNGNEIKVTDSVTNIVTENEYDVANRLSKVTETADGTLRLIQTSQYDGNGQRVEKAENGEVTSYLYQNQAVLGTKNGNGGMTTFNILGADNQPIATSRYSGTYAGKTYFYQKDIKGSTTSLTDEAGTGIITYEYDAFGETVKKGDTSFTNEICYTGAIYDESTGLYYLNARYYDPEDGRFLTQDTYRGEENDPTTWHLYVYCANNPVKYTDPSGHAMALISGIYTTYKVAKGIYTLYKVAVSIGATIVIGEKVYKVVKVVRTTGVGKRKKTKVKLKKQAKIKQASKTAKKSGKERASDIPSWARGKKPNPGEDPKEFVKRILNEKYGNGKWKKGPKTEYNQILKHWHRR